MKELILNREGLTNKAPKAYSEYGDIFMAEPGAVENATRRIEVAAELGEKARRQAAAREALKDPHLPIELRGMFEQVAGESADAISTAGIDSPVIQEALSVINAASRSNLPLQSFERVLERQVEEVAKAKDVKPEDRELALNRIREISKALAESERLSKEESKFGQVLSVQENQIEDPIVRGYVPEVNRLIDQIKSGRLDDAKYDELHKKIEALQPPDDYGVVSTAGDDEASQETSRAEAKIREAKMNAFDLGKQTLKSAMSEARRIMMPSGREAESKKMTEAIVKLISAIEGEDYESIDKIILESGFSPGDREGIYSEIIVRSAEEAEKLGNRDHMVEYLLEYGLERIISRADENPTEAYPQFNLYESYNIDNIIQAARRYDEGPNKKPENKREMFGYLTNLQYKRQAMHQLFQGMKDRKNYVSLVTQLLRRNGLDFVEHEIAGVADVQMVYEQVLGSRLSFAKNWLNHQDFEEADKEVTGILKGYEGKNTEVLRKEYTRNGEIATRSLRPWEIRRAGVVGRSLNTATERRIIYGILGDLPASLHPDERFRSLEFEFIARTLAPLKLVPEKFFSQPIAMRYFEILYEELKGGLGKENLHKYGYVGEDGEGRGLYGKTQKALAVLDTGIPDLKSNSWRGRLLLLKNPFYKTAIEHGRKYSIGEYFDHVRDEIKEEQERKIREMKPDVTDLELEHALNNKKYPWRSAFEKAFNDRVAGQVSNQRLFLGALAKNVGDLNEANKKVIWENVARFLPSRIAAFLPEETIGIVKSIYGITDKQEAIKKWDEFKVKLFRIERARVKRDAIALRTYNDGRDESKIDRQTKEIDAFFDSENLTQNEKTLIGQIQSLGRSHARDFAKMTFPFTPFLDDAPETAWNNLEDNDLDRLLVRDHSAFEEGWGAVTGLIANSGAKPEDVIKAFEKGFEGISNPLGIGDAQKKLEPFINAYMRISRVNNWAKYLGPIMKLARSPRSEAERYNLQSEIAINEGVQSNILNTLAQHEVISDDPTEADEHGKTQLARIKDKNKLDIKALLLMHFRIVAMLFGTVFALQLFKSILPADMAKELG